MKSPRPIAAGDATALPRRLNDLPYTLNSFRPIKSGLLTTKPPKGSPQPSAFPTGHGLARTRYSRKLSVAPGSTSSKLLAGAVIVTTSFQLESVVEYCSV